MPIAFIHVSLLMYCQKFAFFGRKFFDLFASYKRRCKNVEIEATLDARNTCGQSCAEDHRDEGT